LREANPEYVRSVIGLANACPYFRLISMSITDLKASSAEMEAEFTQKHLQAFGYVHGGVFASIIDTAIYWAAHLNLDEGDGVTSVDLKVNYLAPARSGKVFARGVMIKMGKTLGLGEAEIKDRDGRILAHGTSTLMIVPGYVPSGNQALPPKFR